MNVAFDRDAPSADQIAQMRARFDVEPEVDRALTRKLHNRSGPPYEPLPLDALVQGVRRLVSAGVGDQEFEITDAAWMAGGASKLQMRFVLNGAGFDSAVMVLRTDPAESLHATSRLREYQMTRALHAASVLPVPVAHFVDAEADHLPYPGIVYELVDGVTKPTDTNSVISGLGTYLPADLRRVLAPQIVEHLARLYPFGFWRSQLSAFAVPKPGTQNALWAVNWWDRAWAEDAAQQIPLVALASNWLKKQAPAVEYLSVVHGDFRTGNYLFGAGFGRSIATHTGEPRDRRVALDHVVNFRDIGGYPTRQGRQVRWGRVFRSDAPIELSGDDRDMLRNLNIRTVVDLQDVNERASHPTTRLDGTTVHEIGFLPHGAGEIVAAASGGRETSWSTRPGRSSFNPSPTSPMTNGAKSSTRTSPGPSECRASSASVESQPGSLAQS